MCPELLYSPKRQDWWNYSTDNCSENQCRYQKSILERSGIYVMIGVWKWENILIKVSNCKKHFFYQAPMIRFSSFIIKVMIWRLYNEKKCFFLKNVTSESPFVFFNKLDFFWSKPAKFTYLFSQKPLNPPKYKSLKMQLKTQKKTIYIYNIYIILLRQWTCQTLCFWL